MQHNGTSNALRKIQPASAYVGTSGWSYESWRDSWYREVPRAAWLAFCAQRFTGIEVNATFYRLQSRTTFRRWRDAVPTSFRFAIKAHHYLTHNKKLADPIPSIRLERSRAAGLGAKLAVVVWQLPQRAKRDLSRLESFGRALRSWSNVRHAIEFRNESWFDDEVAACLGRYGIAVCQSDAADWPLWSAVTTDLVYVRLHGHATTYASAYSDKELRSWASRVRHWLREGRDVHVYFDNDAFGNAPRDALRLIAMLPRYQRQNKTDPAAGASSDPTVFRAATS
ncbi:MAG TPA: DUF72 domain-containing protein [Burkholderiaceae bacterium]|nr:DUF72 domain-containing protein [Burkholderiaceae bacterium]